MDGPRVYQLPRPGQTLGSSVRDREALTASKREAGPKMRCPARRKTPRKRPPVDHRVDRPYVDTR